MRLVVLSDTHLRSPDGIPRRALRDMDAADRVIHCGDFRHEAILEHLRSRFPLEAVHGNRDEPGIRRQLPARKVLDLAGVRVGITHGWGSPFGLARRVKALFRDASIVLFGHSHIACHKILDGTVLFNPGTVSALPLNFRRTYGRIHLDGERVRCEIVPVDGASR